MHHQHQAIAERIDHHRDVQRGSLSLQLLPRHEGGNGDQGRGQRP